MHFRTRLIWQFAVLFLACAFTATPAVPTNTTYRFVGQCGDCTGTGTGQLVLQNYTLGTPITNANFVSFTYSSNLINFTILASDNPFVNGTLPVNLPAAADVTINGPSNSKALQTSALGSWCAGLSCSADFGANSTWSLPVAPPTTVGAPVLSNSVLIGLALGIAAMGGLLLKSRAARA